MQKATLQLADVFGIVDESAVDTPNPGERVQVAKVIAAAAVEGLPLVIHIGRGNFNAADEELFIIRGVLPRAYAAPLGFPARIDLQPLPAVA